MNDNARFLFKRIFFGCSVLLHLAWYTWCAVACDNENICQCNAGTGGNLIVDCSRKDLLKMPKGMPISAYDLRLEKNDIAKVPHGYFDNLTELTYLKINNNKIAVLPEGLFDNAVNLVEVNFNYNLLTEIPDGLFSNMPKLNWLFVEGNPLDCSCPVEKFRTWLLSLDQSITVDAECETGEKVVDIPGASFDVCIVTTTSTTTTTTTTTTTLPPTTTTTTTTITTSIPTTEETAIIISVVPEEGDALVTFVISLILLVIIVLTCIGVLVLNYKYRNLLKIQPEKEGEFDKPDETEAEEKVNLTDNRY